jgi:hypothetical protein
VPELEIRIRPPSMLRNIDSEPPYEVPELEIRECPPSTLGNVDDGSPWWVLTEIRKRPPSTLKNVDDSPLGPVGVPVPIWDLKGAL